jgi:chemotaxis-related protein WspB
MQLLTFTVGGQDYAIESRRVIEVLPLVPGRPIPHTPDYVLGVFAYRGRLVPLVDLGRRIADLAPAERLSTRVIVVECILPGRPDPATGPSDTATPPDTVRLGLVAENVIAIRSVTTGDTVLPRLDLPEAPFLGPILRIGDRTVQLVRIDHLLPADLAAGLFPATAEVPLP